MKRDDLKKLIIANAAEELGRSLQEMIDLAADESASIFEHWKVSQIQLVIIMMNVEKELYRLGVDIFVPSDKLFGARNFDELLNVIAAEIYLVVNGRSLRLAAAEKAKVLGGNVKKIVPLWQ